MNKATYTMLIKTVGIPATITHKKDGATASVPRIGIANARAVGDVNILNAYGINARIVTVLADDIAFELEKFDVVQTSGETLVIDAVIKVHEPGTGNVIGYRGIVRGK